MSRNLLDGYAGLLERGGGTARRENRYAAGVQRARKVDQTGLVGNREEGEFDHREVKCRNIRWRSRAHRQRREMSRSRSAHLSRSPRIGDDDPARIQVLVVSARLRLVVKTVGLELLSERAAIDAEDRCSAALIAFRIIEHGFEERRLDLAHDQIVQLTGLMPVERGKVLLES